LGRIDFGFVFLDFIRAHTNWTAGAHRAPAFLFSGAFGDDEDEAMTVSNLE
jgi:hypothetical protein